MKKIIISFMLVLSLAILATGCASLVVPYHESPACNKGITGGYCTGLSEVYDVVSEDIRQNGAYMGPRNKR